MAQFAGKVVLVFGGSSGIGRAAAVAFAREGASVAVAARNEQGAAETVKAVIAAGGQGFVARTDVTRPSDVEATVKATQDRFGGLDCAFNNAGWEGTRVPTHEIALADWQKMMDIKLNGTWYCMKHEIAAMLPRGGAIVNMAGNWGLTGAANYASYCAAAHGIMGLTRAAALEYAGRRIRVNAVCPRAVDAPLLERMTGGDRAAISRLGAAMAMGRPASVAEVAASVLWLCSDAASYVNGHGLVLDGGGRR